MFLIIAALVNRFTVFPSWITDQDEEAFCPLHRQLLSAYPVLLLSGLGLLPDLRLRGREAQLQGHCAARCHCDAAYSQRDSAFLFRQDTAYR